MKNILSILFVALLGAPALAAPVTNYPAASAVNDSDSVYVYQAGTPHDTHETLAQQKAYMWSGLQTNYAPFAGSTNYAPISGSPNYLWPSNNLSDLTNAATARTNLGLGSAATNAASAFAPASGSTNYAPFANSANYAPMYGSTNYAPISGSTNYDTNGAAAAVASASVTGIRKGAGAPANDTAAVADTDYADPFTVIQFKGGPLSHNFIFLGDSITEAPHDDLGYTQQSFVAAVQTLGLGANGSLCFNMGLQQNTAADELGIWYGQLNVGPANTTATYNTATNVVSVASTNTSNSPPVPGWSFMGVDVPINDTITAVNGTNLTLALNPLGNHTNVNVSVAAGVKNVHTGEYASGSMANGMNQNFYNSPYQLSYAISGIPTDVFILLGANDMYENTGAATTLTATTTSGSPNLTVTSGSGTYSSLVYGLVLSGTGIPTSPLPPYIASGQGTANLVMSANATASGSVTITVHYPHTSLASWTTTMTSLVALAHAGGDIVTVGHILPAGNAGAGSQGDPIAEVFRGRMNAAIDAKAMGQDFTSLTDSVMPPFGSVVGSPLYWTDSLHLSVKGCNVLGKFIVGDYFRQQPSLNVTKWSPAGLGSLTPGDSTIYVSGTKGDDQKFIGEKYSRAQPYRTITKALAVAQSGDSIYVVDGAITDANLTLKNNVNITLGAGVTSWICPVSSYLFSDGSATVNCTITGAGQTISYNSSFTTAIQLYGTSSNLIWQNIGLSVPGGGLTWLVSETGASASLVMTGTITCGSQMVNLTGNSASFVFNGAIKSSHSGGQVFNFGSGTSKICTINGSVTSTGTDQVFCNNFDSSTVVTVSGAVSAGAGQAIAHSGFTPTDTYTFGSLTEGSTVSDLTGVTLSILSPVPVVTTLASPNTTAFTQSFSGGVVDQTIRVTNTATMASATFTLPSNINSRINEKCRVVNASTYAMTAFTATVPSGSPSTPYGCPTTLAAGGSVTFTKTAANEWVAQ